MGTKIAIIGLGEIGASIGLALKAHGVPERIVGHDRDRGVERTAKAGGAVDATAGLVDAIRDASLVFLCLPLASMQEIAQGIAGALGDGAVVIDTAPIKARMAVLLGESLPGGCQHIGIVPAPGPRLLAASERGIDAADAELFRGAVMMIVPSARTSEGTEQLAMNIARMLGAKPMLTDPAEADGIMTTVHILPQLASAALLEASIGAGGWDDARKLAGRPFTGVSGGLAYYDDPDSVHLASLANPTRVAHSLDLLIASLQSLRDQITAQDSGALLERLNFDFQNRENWLDERTEARWIVEGDQTVTLPSIGDQVAQLFLGGRIAEATKARNEKLRQKR